MKITIFVRFKGMDELTI
jgi:hypothetical protein